MRSVIMLVDLHATKVDELSAVAARLLDGSYRCACGGWEHCSSLDIQSVRLQASLAAGLGKTDGIENSERNSVACCSLHYLRLAGIGRRIGSKDQATRYR